LADFYRHPEWDHSTVKVEKTKDGDSSGVGAEWKIHETFDLFRTGLKESEKKKATGLVKRVLREVVPNQKVEWHAYPIPRVGVSADYTFRLEPDGSGTKVTQQVTLNVIGLVDAVARRITWDLDTNVQKIWTQNLQQLQSVVTQSKAA
jgi:hypothetical protein